MAATSRAVVPGAPCATCSRPLRPAGKRPADYPGMFSHGGGGDCTACYSRKRNARVKPPEPVETLATGTPCTQCQRPLRSTSVPKVDAPDTIAHRAGGMCGKCWKEHGKPEVRDPDALVKASNSQGQIRHLRRRCGLPKRPKDLTPEELALRMAVEELVEERRRRGIPREGLIPA